VTARLMRRRSLIASAGLGALALLITGCGDDKPAAPPPKGASAPLFAKLPRQYQDSKVIKVGSNVAYPPMEYFEKGEKTPTGVDPDLAKALAEQLGVQLQFQNADFDGLITQLQSKRIDVIMSSMSDNKDRQTGIDPDTKKKIGPGLNFVDYFNAGLSILVKKGNPQGIKSLDDLCGKTIALQQGTTQEQNAKDQQKKCKSAGKPELKVLSFKQDPEALLQVKQGRAVADLNDFPVAAYNAKTSGGGDDFEIAGQQFDAGPYGIGVRKDDTQLRDALQAAVQAIIDNGEYRKVMDKWGVSQGALPKATVNAGT